MPVYQKYMPPQIAYYDLRVSRETWQAWTPGETVYRHDFFQAGEAGSIETLAATLVVDRAADADHLPTFRMFSFSVGGVAVPYEHVCIELE